jgi:hypothetical protein
MENPETSFLLSRFSRIGIASGPPEDRKSRRAGGGMRRGRPGVYRNNTWSEYIHPETEICKLRFPWGSNFFRWKFKALMREMVAGKNIGTLNAGCPKQPGIRLGFENITHTEERSSSMKKTTIYAATAFLLALGMAFSIPAMAESEWTQPETAAPRANIEDREIRRAARAYAEIGTINQGLQQTMQQAEDQAERMKMQRRAEGEMIRAIEEVGLDIQRYNEIIEVVRMDEGLRNDFNEELQSIDG